MSQVKLASKLIKIMASIDRVAKTGHNSHQNYDYVTEATVLETVRQELIKQNVFVFTSVENAVLENHSKNDKPLLITTVTLNHIFVDADSGEKFEVKSVGSGYDSTDKGVFKAITGATKYFWMKNLMLPSGDDPENDETVKANAQSTQQSKTTFTPKSFGTSFVKQTETPVNTQVNVAVTNDKVIDSSQVTEKLNTSVTNTRPTFQKRTPSTKPA